MTLNEATEILGSTPRVLQSWLGYLSEGWTHCTTDPGTFSPYDVIGHLIHGERTDWVVRLRHILEYDKSRPFEPFDRFAMFEESKGKSLTELLSEFSELRMRNLNELANLKLTDADLKQEGLHPELGTVSVSQLIATWAVHDLNHIGQIARTMAFRYRDEVGPWRQYLSILPQT